MISSTGSLSLKSFYWQQQSGRHLKVGFVICLSIFPPIHLDTHAEIVLISRPNRAVPRLFFSKHWCLSALTGLSFTEWGEIQTSGPIHQCQWASEVFSDGHELESELTVLKSHNRKTLQHEIKTENNPLSWQWLSVSSDICWAYYWHGQ